MEFKGTNKRLERKYVSGICIGIGTTGDYSQIIANSVLPYTDDEYEMQKQEIEANMLLYSKAPEMLEMLKELREIFDKYEVDFESQFFKYKQPLEQLIKEATEI